MASMKKLLNEHYGETSPMEDQTFHQRQMNHHSCKAMEVGRMARNHAFMADSIQDDDPKGLHTELSRAYGDAAKIHLALADHHTAKFKKERTDTVKDMTKPLKPAIGGKDGVK